MDATKPESVGSATLSTPLPVGASNQKGMEVAPVPLLLAAFSDVSKTNPFFQMTKWSGLRLKNASPLPYVFAVQPHANVGINVAPSTFTYARVPAAAVSPFRKRLAVRTAPFMTFRMFVQTLRAAPKLRRVVRNSVPVPEIVASPVPFVLMQKPPSCTVARTSVSFVPPVCTNSPEPPHPA